MVNTATKASSTAGAIVHITSRRGAPWICLGTSSSWPFLRRNRTMIRRVTTKTRTPDDAGDDEDGNLQVLDLLGLRALGLEDVERGVLGATGQRKAERRRRRAAPTGARAGDAACVRSTSATSATVPLGPLLLGHHGTTTFPSSTPRLSPVCDLNVKMPGFGMVTCQHRRLAAADVVGVEGDGLGDAVAVGVLDLLAVGAELGLGAGVHDELAGHACRRSRTAG